MSATDNLDFDLIVVGGGPGGSTVSTLVAMQGHRVLLLEKEEFPRYQIGESLLPSTVHGICRLLGVSEELEKASFMPKRGGTFRWGKSPEPWTFSFSISEAFSGPTSVAYQVERMKFDQILLNNARDKGVDVREGSAVVDVIDDDGRVRGVVYTDPAGNRRKAHSRFVVDASGNKSRIHGQVGGKRHYSEFFKNIAIFGYFEGGKRLPAPNSGNILCAAFESGWFWYIPLTEKLTSVGVVLRRDALERVQGDRVKALQTLIQECPLIAEYLADARRVESGPYGEVRIRKDYSYCQENFWRPGFALVGDAACFIDPVFSSGVHLATYSALLAARSINTVLDGELDETRCFEEYEARYRDEYSLFHDFLVAFYDMHQDENSYFWSAKKVTNSSASQLESFVELVGGGASHESGLLKATSYGEQRAALFQEFSELIESPADEDGTDRDLFESELVESVLEQGAKIQVQATFGESADDDVPVREGGLVPSPDGMHWAEPAAAATPPRLTAHSSTDTLS
ncbi:tryptophan 7-halogenase [Streptomyces prunicolor]|uniref:Tryptophan 7-halogenase n=1 Tax=Streptomyces prunicolor TaxID=67348 RepID=A0ABU4FT06_9ACTN|nr:tryptophan 7-halogenase [Streptomyces prunicolor]MCX5243624.1 tryptophan 7-halogenase [Streptomyces prunicolor]MDV7223705.1 tryptophan 7-halogenase [Streptomyces prunicolor]